MAEIPTGFGNAFRANADFLAANQRASIAGQGLASASRALSGIVSQMNQARQFQQNAESLAQRIEQIDPASASLIRDRASTFRSNFLDPAADATARDSIRNLFTQQIAVGGIERQQRATEAKLTQDAEQRRLDRLSREKIAGMQLDAAGRRSGVSGGIGDLTAQEHSMLLGMETALNRIAAKEAAGQQLTLEDQALRQTAISSYFRIAGQPFNYEGAVDAFRSSISQTPVGRAQADIADLAGADDAGAGTTSGQGLAAAAASAITGGRVNPGGAPPSLFTNPVQGLTDTVARAFGGRDNLRDVSANAREAAGRGQIFEAPTPQTLSGARSLIESANPAIRALQGSDLGDSGLVADPSLRAPLPPIPDAAPSNIPAAPAGAAPLSSTGSTSTGSPLSSTASSFAGAGSGRSVPALPRAIPIPVATPVARPVPTARPVVAPSPAPAPAPAPAPVPASAGDLQEPQRMFRGTLRGLPENQVFRYDIQPGETLQDIARRFDTSVTELRRINTLPSGFKPEPGDRLFIPNSGANFTEPELPTSGVLGSGLLFPREVRP